MKIYISGKITGMDLSESKELFARAENILMIKGWKVKNPHKFQFDTSNGERWEMYMRVCIKELCDCDAIYLLPNWMSSEGAQWELNIARRLGLRIFNGSVDRVPKPSELTSDFSGINAVQDGVSKIEEL